jgi:hypothetical protein
LLSLALSSVAGLLLAPALAGAEDAYRVSGPLTHENLAIYFVHGKSAPGAVPLTLQEALTKGTVRVHETSNVNELQIENLGGSEIFVQSGDIVKGGKQDRVLMVSLIVPPHSGRLQIASFCVEQGRWSPRGQENAARFESANASMPSRKAKLAMKAPQPVTTASARRGEISSRQQEVWADVAKTQSKLAGNLGQPVASPQSASSLQLALENEKLQDAKAAYVKNLQARGEEGADIIGYVFAINGKLNSADVYPSNGLFRKMWPKLLAASVTEAVADKGEAGADIPDVLAVQSFLAAAETGKATERELIKNVRLDTRDGDQAFYFETKRAGGSFVHRNYLAK